MNNDLLQEVWDVTLEWSRAALMAGHVYDRERRADPTSLEPYRKLVAAAERNIAGAAIRRVLYDGGFRPTSPQETAKQ